MNMDFDNQLPEDDLIREFIDGLIREWKYEVPQFDVNQVEWAETLIEEIERLENPAEEPRSDDSRELLFKVKQLARQAKQKSQNALFPAETRSEPVSCAY